MAAPLTTPYSPYLPDTNAILAEGGDLAQQTTPLQLGGILEALTQLRAKASGSVADIMPGIMGQLSDLRSQYVGASQAISRRLGFSGGGQVLRGKQGVLTSATRQYAQLLGQGQQAGMSGLINTLGGFQPLLSGAAQPPSVSTTYGTQNKAREGMILGQSLESILQTINRLRPTDTTNVGTGGAVTIPESNAPIFETELP